MPRPRPFARVAIAVALGIGVAGGGLGLACGPRPLVEADLTTTTLRIEGMVCDSCEEGIRAAVEKLDGVASCVADHEAKTATIRHDPARAPVDAITAAIERLGYTVVGR